MADDSILERIRGVRIETGANRSFAMDDPDRVWFVERGYLDVFAVESSGGRVTGRRRFVARVRTGEMAFGARPVEAPDGPERTFGLLAVPSRDAVLVEGDRDGIAAERFDLKSTNWIDQWVTRLSDFLVRHLAPARSVLLLEADPDVAYAGGSVLAAQHRDLVWVSADAPVRFLGREDLTVDAGAPPLPVTERTWLTLEADTRVSAVHTPTAHARDLLWAGFDRFGVRVLGFALIADAEEADALDARHGAGRRARNASISRAVHGFAEVMGGTREDGAPERQDATPLYRAVELVAAECGVSLDPPPAGGALGAAPETIETIAARSGVRIRRVRLDAGWWRRAGPSMIGFQVGEGGWNRPLALLSGDRDACQAVDPTTGETFAVNRRTADRIAGEGIVFYPPLPEQIESAADVVRFSLHRRSADFRDILAVGVVAGLASLLTPILTGQILVEILPRSDMSLWLVSFAALLMVAFGNGVFEAVRGLASLRIESRMDERLQAAVWSRLVSLPAPFFRRFTAGDLANRANGIAAVRQSVTGAAVQAAMAAISSFFSLALLFWYSGFLALLVLALLLVLGSANWFLSVAQLRRYREMFRAQGELSGYLFQLIGGLAKLRVANAEIYALTGWARRYAAQRREGLGALRWAAGQQAFAAAFQPLSMVIVFAAVHYSLTGEGSSFDLPAFLSFNAAFGQLTGAIVSLSTAATTVVGVIPLAERVRPILDAEPEDARRGIDPGELKGDIEFRGVTFRYGPDVPNAVDGVSFRIRQGDYVAFVGPSGCGKSTIYRLLLGFDRPDSGAVFLDGHDVNSLDLPPVRRRMGVVLQHGQIVAGSIYENVAGMSPLTAEDTWSALRAAAMEDDVRAMPMGLRTVLPEGGVGLSTGQKQRLLIARAIARKPRLLLFDEATSALDNRAQATVQKSLKQLGVTRVVIAHRLSSIRDVDRIYVLDQGRVVESGSYDELMEQDGVFASLTRRQLLRPGTAG